MKFDFVVVGGGSAGCILANRLSKLSNKTVALLEAGYPDNSPVLSTPALLGLPVSGRTKYSWNYETAPQENLHNRKLYWPRGKTLGGSSSINAMVYIRGQPEDYDSWKIPGWSWNEMLPRFKSHQRQKNMDSVAEGFHGDTGELSVSNQYYTHPFTHLFVNAAEELGEKINPDFNGKEQEGFGIYQVTIDNGVRWSSSRAFLTPDVLKRENLTVFTNYHATKLEVNQATKEIQGVHCVDTSKVKGASKLEEESPVFIEAGETILCGGAVNSPQLLLLSGIGPKEELEKHSITSVHELPGVGQNLKDHLDVILTCAESTSEAYGFPGSLSGLTKSLKDLYSYYREKRGPLSSNAAEGGGFICSSSEVTRPDIQYHFCPGLINDHARQLSVKKGYSLHVCNLRPKSSGTIGLTSANPFAHPHIDPKYLSHPEDLNVMFQGLKKGLPIITSSQFKNHHRELTTPPPSCVSDADLKDWIRNNAETIYHPVGTCKMGLSDDSLAVVDEKLSVHGMQRLRVADASIMPDIVSGNTNAPSIAIGDACAEFITQKEQAS